MAFRLAGRIVCLSLVALAACPLAAANPAAENARLEVTVTPPYTREPGSVTVTVRHLPASDDRQMTVEVESDACFRGSSFPLNGDRERQLHDVVLKALPAGDYRVRVTIDGAEPAEGGGRFSVCQRQPSGRDAACDVGGGRRR